MALIDEVRKVLNRLARHGWRDLIREVSGGVVDILASDLQSELLQPVSKVHRSITGFEDFAEEGTRAIEPGMPAYSFLYHALAHPAVVSKPDGSALSAFPMLAEIDIVENYVFGANPYPQTALRARVHERELSIVMFACEYRPAPDTVHRKHADLCFSRTGVARAGTSDPLYDERRRHFVPLVDGKVHAFRVMPARYAAYLAIREKGESSVFGPMRFQDGDESRQFWVPVQKLFSGTECIQGLDLHVAFEAHHCNQKLRKFHVVLNQEGYDTGWKEPDISKPPFVNTKHLAELSHQPEFGPGVLVPVPHPDLVEPASYKGKPLTFNLAKNYHKASSGLLTNLTTSLWLSPRENARYGPEFVNIRHQVLPDGRTVNLNNLADATQRTAEGGYVCRHFVDFAADGYVQARVPELAAEVRKSLAAYSVVTPPSFFPFVNQRELMSWTQNILPTDLGKAIWAEPPKVLSDRRYAGNVELHGCGFDLNDDTMCAIVSQPYTTPQQQRPLYADEIHRPSMLPDSSAGYFDPGWDTTISHDADRAKQFMQNYGLGSPFLEDAKLCAAFGAFWPAVAPDATREFQPSADWPTVAPLTDEEIGLNGGIAWDGVPGPRLLKNQKSVVYTNFNNTDYTENKLSAALTAKINVHEYKARVLAMAWVYWALGIDNAEYFRKYKNPNDAAVKIIDAKARWAVLSFTKASKTDTELREAEKRTKTDLDGPKLYRFQVYRWGKGEQDAKNPRQFTVEVREMVTLYIDLMTILMRIEDNPWEAKKIPLQ